MKSLENWRFIQRPQYGDTLDYNGVLYYSLISFQTAKISSHINLVVQWLLDFCILRGEQAHMQYLRIPNEQGGYCSQFYCLKKLLICNCRMVPASKGCTER